MPPSSCSTLSMPSPRSHSAAFSQRMPPVQKLTTVASASASRCGASASGRSVKLSIGSVNAPAKRAVADFLAVAGVEQHHAAGRRRRRPARSSAPASSARPRARAPQRRGAVATERDDLALDLHLEPRERLRAAAAFLDPDRGEARIARATVEETADGRLGAAEEQVDALFRHQHGAAQVERPGVLADIVWPLWCGSATGTKR